MLYAVGWGMKTARHLGVVILLLVSYLTPAIACVASNARMSAQQSACCRTMGEQCDYPDKPAAHGCCQATLPGSHAAVLDTKTVTFHPVFTAIVYAALSGLVTSSASATEWVDCPEYYPPDSPSASVSILRI
jgi:hypothetical protein